MWAGRDWGNSGCWRLGSWPGWGGGGGRPGFGVAALGGGEVDPWDVGLDDGVGGWVGGGVTGLTARRRTWESSGAGRRGGTNPPSTFTPPSCAFSVLMDFSSPNLALSLSSPPIHSSLSVPSPPNLINSVSLNPTP